MVMPVASCFLLGRAASSSNLGLSPSSASSWSRAAGSSYSSRAAKRQIVVLGSAVTVSNHVAGEGTVLGSAALYQDRAYWEVLSCDQDGLGVARRCPSDFLI